MACVGPDPPVPPRPAADLHDDQDGTGFAVDLGDLWDSVEASLRAAAPLARRELGLPHFAVTGVFGMVTVHRPDGTFHSGVMGAGVGARRIEFSYACSAATVPFAGGALRLYDTEDDNGFARAVDTFTEVEPIDDAVTFFPSDAHHDTARTVPADGTAPGPAGTVAPVARFTVRGWLAGDPVGRGLPDVSPAVRDVLHQRYLPRLAEAGYVVRPTPRPVQELLLALLELRRGRRRPEEVDPRYHVGNLPDLIDVSDLGDEILERLLPIHEAFAGVRLVPSQVYGIRCYVAGNVLHLHTDRPATHVVSSVLQVDQEVDRPWPLQLDIDGRRHEVVLEPGQMLLYEGASCTHGRITPLAGRRFANVFVHYRPVAWPWTADAVVDAALRGGIIDGDGQLVDG